MRIQGLKNEETLRKPQEKKVRHEAGRKVLHMINHSMCLKIGIALFTLGFLTMNNGLDGFGVSKLKKHQKVDVPYFCLCHVYKIDALALACKLPAYTQGVVGQWMLVVY